MQAILQIKDIVAFANSGGGVIVFGVADDGSGTKFDPTAVLKLDSAKIGDRVAKYTGTHFGDFETAAVARSDGVCAALLIGAAEVPLIFVKPGAYEIVLEGGKRQPKTAFGAGTIYFRHGSKSEPGCRDDLLSWRDAEIERVRKAWLGGIRKVVALDPEEKTTMAAAAEAPPDGTVIAASPTNDPSVFRFFPRNAEEVWLLRQKDLIAEVNSRLPTSVKITTHDITCLKAKYDLFNEHPDFACKPHRMSAPQCSAKLVEWIIEQHRADEKFFAAARDEYNRKR